MFGLVGLYQGSIKRYYVSQESVCWSVCLFVQLERRSVLTLQLTKQRGSRMLKTITKQVKCVKKPLWSCVWLCCSVKVHFPSLKSVSVVAGLDWLNYVISEVNEKYFSSLDLLKSNIYYTRDFTKSKHIKMLLLEIPVNIGVGGKKTLLTHLGCFSSSSICAENDWFKLIEHTAH